jgi:hypothetical protein
MSNAREAPPDSWLHWVVVRADPTGQFTAQVVGLPELQSTAAVKDDAVEEVRAMLADWFAAGRLVPIGRRKRGRIYLSVTDK